MGIQETLIVMTLLFLLGVILLVCWLALPFILMGTNALLRQVLAEARRTNQLLDERLPALRRGQPDGAGSSASPREARKESR